MRDFMMISETLGNEAKAQVTGHLGRCKGWLGGQRLSEELPLTMEDGSSHGEGEAAWRLEERRPQRRYLSPFGKDHPLGLA